jgi:hypothetical protein
MNNAAVARLKELAILQQKIQREVDEIWLKSIKPLIDSCDTWEEFHGAVSIQWCDADGEMIDSLGLWSVRMAFAADHYRQRERAKMIEFFKGAE